MKPNYSGFSQGLHSGIDLIAASGTPVVAGMNGTIENIYDYNNFSFG